jgi:hypothetical protein
MRPFAEFENETNALLSQPSNFVYRSANDFAEYGIFPQQV